MAQILEFDPSGSEMVFEDPYSQHNLMCESPRSPVDRQVLLAKEVREMRRDLRCFMRAFALFANRELERTGDLPRYTEALPSHEELRNSLAQ